MYKRILLILILALSYQNAFSGEYAKECASIFIGAYQGYLSPLKSPASTCQFSPSCSEFAKEAINEYGLIEGIPIAADRLLRCSGGHADLTAYPRMNKKFFDPPEKNYIFGDGGLWKITFSGAGGADTSRPKVKDTIFAFPKFLFNKKDFTSSKLEINRIIFNNNSSEIQNKANILLALNEFAQAKYSQALGILSDLDASSSAETKEKVFRLKYLCADFQNLNEFNVNLCKDYKDENNFELALKLRSYSFYKDDEIDSSLKQIDLLRTRIGDTACDSLKLFTSSIAGYKAKSTLFAGISSAILPGAGYFYVGRYKEGASALIINGLLGWGIYSLFHNHNTGSGVLTSLVAFPFYAGNIIGAANAAESENNKAFQMNLNELRSRLKISFVFSADSFENLWE